MDFKEKSRGVWEVENHNALPEAYRLVICAAVHGDEPAGIVGLEYLKTSDIKLTQNIQSITLVIGNPEAQEKNVRAIDVDLNRVWDETADYDTSTVEYQRSQELKPMIFRPHTVLLDLHTTSAVHESFVILDHFPDEQMHGVISQLPCQFITYNWKHFIGKKTISGGLHAYDHSSVSFTVELGQHESEDARENAIRVISTFVNYFNGQKTHISAESSSKKWLKIMQQLTLPGVTWEWNGDIAGPHLVTAGEVIGYADGVEYHAPFDGYVVMPNKKFSPVNTDLCFFAIEKEYHES